MKRYIKSSILPDKVLTVDIVIDYKDEKIAAAIITHPDSIKKRKRINEYKLTILNDVAMSAINSINNHHFEMKNHLFQSRIPIRARQQHILTNKLSFSY